MFRFVIHKISPTPFPKRDIVRALHILEQIPLWDNEIKYHYKSLLRLTDFYFRVAETKTYAILFISTKVSEVYSAFLW